jgi:cellulose synthase operon protein C
MARFILDHAWHARPPLPFVILDIDRPSVEPLRPDTFLVEALGQLVQQFERMREPAEELIGAIIDQLDRQETVLLESVAPVDNFVAKFASLVGPFIGDSPLLFIVDTFEEVSYLGRDVENIVFGFIAELSDALPQLRVIIVGRAAPQGRNLYYVPLGELPPDAAKVLIVDTLKSLDVKPPRDKLLTDIVAEVGGNPMVLRLAARLLAEEDVEGLRDAARRQWLQRVRIEVLQARLYGRILGHIHDTNVKKLAFPGLVVRRITRGVVKEVLAQACDLNLQGDNEVDKLIDIMGREVALVSRQADNSLTYRSDIRRVMLQTLNETVPAETVKAIDLRAVTYWSGQAGPAARAEELYHRLRLAQDRSTLDDRWDPATLTYLRGALGELPAASQAWLANKMGASLDTDARAGAVQVDWEESAARIARRLLENGQAGDALQILRERLERLEGSPLYALEARALYILERLDEALGVTEIGLKALLHGGDAPARIDLQLLRALILERTGDLHAARAQVEEAIQLARAANTRRSLLRAQLRMLRLDRKMALMEERDALREEALSIIEQLGLQTLRSDSVLLTDAAAELGEIAPEILLLAIDQIGADILRQTSRPLLSRVIVEAGGIPASDVAKFIGGDPREVAKFAINGLVNAIQRQPARSDASHLGSLVFQEASDSSVQRTARSEQRTISKLFAGASYTGRSLVPIAQVIEENFTQEDLRRILRLYLSRSLERYMPPDGPFREQIFFLLDSAAREGWVPDLLEALCTVSENPKLRTDFEDILFAAS